ncbi:hypothetical protein KG112_09360 [Nocardioides sp. zg-ZUI104]|uniref:hypothetical protein n=1 Tax=Nocardioides faecalis TaxID=2803858 RepID=UPI001BCAC8EF|nr:hypothetical protein [Nocardioides faecalis]MBS4753011.1 hypothetical protein [Nocardioides faecalis]
MSSVEPKAVSEYRLAPAVTARFVGSYLVLLAFVLLGATALTAALDINADLMVLVLGLGLLGLIALAWWLRSTPVVQLTAAGYRVRLVRAAGVKEARWSEVEDAVAATPRGIECVVLRLRDGRVTNVPVAVLAADKDDFARDVREHLRAASR